ncbi:SGNH hydrolase domain-containing protein [bacterium]|nr:SGNH hydrolase domain-containing protein [bacterium]
MIAPRLYKESPLVKNCNSSTSLDSCTSVSKNSINNIKFIVIGDSHSYHLNGLFHELKKNYDLESLIYTSTGQLYPDLKYSSKYRSLSTWDSENDSMNAFISFVNPILDANTIFVLSSRLEFYFIKDKFNLEHQNLNISLFDEENKLISESKALQNWIRKVNRVATNLKTKNIPLVIFSPIPVFKGLSSGNSYSLCSKAVFRPSVPEFCNEQIPRNILIKRFDNIRAALNKISTTNNNIYIFDPFIHLCPPQNTSCDRSIFNIQYMDDDDHLSFHGSSFLSDSFIRYLKSQNLIDY